jgi:hypothetical protein
VQGAVLQNAMRVAASRIAAHARAAWASQAEFPRQPMLFLPGRYRKESEERYGPWRLVWPIK